jgi:single-strand DNA-binding protein
MPKKTSDKSADEAMAEGPVEGPGPASGPADEAASGSTAETVEIADKPRRTPVLDGDAGDNTIELRGRVSSAPVERELPSGAAIITFRISVARARTPMTGGSMQSADWVDCTAWSARARRAVAAWTVGDPVEVTGALRRRFFRVGAGPSTRVEVEVLSARRSRPRPD